MTSRPASPTCGCRSRIAASTRTTNLLERLFVEERRRLKIIPNGFGEKPVLKLMFGGSRPRRRALARLALHRVRASSDRRHPEGPRCRIRGHDHPFRQAVPDTLFQQIRALTRRTLRLFRDQAAEQWRHATAAA